MPGAAASIRADAVAPPTPVGFVVVPRYERGATTAPTPLRRAEAVQQLADNAFDGRGLPPDSPVFEEARREPAWISQQFFGLRLRARRPELHDPDSYAASQPFGEATRADKGWGIVYESVRHQGGFCVAIFRPPACRPVAQGAHYIYYYDGRRIERIAELREISP
jgi:hypothetical protein